MIERPPSPALPGHDEDEDEDAIDNEDLAALRAIRAHCEEHDLDGLTEEKMRMAHFGIDPENIVLVEDSSRATGYRVLLTEEWLESREDLATAEESLSKALRHEYGYNVDGVGEMGPVEMAEAFAAEATGTSDRGDESGGDPR